MAPASAQTDPPASHGVVERPRDATTYLAYRDTIAFDAMHALYMQHLPATFGMLTGAGLAPGTPTGLYWEWDEEAGTTDMAAAVPFTGVAPPSLEEGYSVITLPAGTAVGLDYYGPYYNLGSAHEAIDAYLGDRASSAVVAIEEYVTDPESEPDPSKWLTRVYYLIPAPE